jgi:uncharacterized protein YndB with AHSA1/START domain
MSVNRKFEATAPLGTAERRGDKHLLFFGRRLHDPIERVWAALTEPDQIGGWLGEAEVDLAVGGEIVVRFLNADPNDFPDGPPTWRATITRLEPPHLLEYEGEGEVARFELREDGDGCVLSFTNERPVTDEDVREFLAGWHIHLDFLADALEGRPITDWANWPRDRFEAVHQRYFGAQIRPSRR